MLFPFASWESPAWRSDLPKYAHTHHNGYPLQLAHLHPARTQSGWLFFKSLDTPDDAGFVVTLPCQPPFITEQLGVQYHTDDSPTYLHRVFEEALRQGHFARVFFLDPHEELRKLDAISPLLLLVGANGWAQWEQLNSSPQAIQWFEHSTAFRWTTSPNKDRFLSMPALELWEQIADQKANPSSDCAFAHRALGLSNRDMSCLLIPKFQESRSELLHALRSALLAQTHLWKEMEDRRWIIKSYKNRWIYLTGFSSRPYALHPLHTILQRVTPHFKRVFNEQVLAQHLEAARWAHRHEETLTIRIEDPTAHERLEAAIFWQEWQDAHPLMP